MAFFSLLTNHGRQHSVLLLLAHGAYVAQEAFVLGALHGAAFEQAAVDVGGDIFPVLGGHAA